MNYTTILVVLDGTPSSITESGKFMLNPRARALVEVVDGSHLQLHSFLRSKQGRAYC